MEAMMRSELEVVEDARGGDQVITTYSINLVLHVAARREEGNY
jgi:hypothetical protein